MRWVDERIGFQHHSLDYNSFIVAEFLSILMFFFMEEGKILLATLQSLHCQSVWAENAVLCHSTIVPTFFL